MTAPGNVNGFSVTPVPSNIAVRWTNPVDSDFAGVRVQRKTTGYPTNYADGVTVYEGNGTNASDVGLADGSTTNYYKAFAFDEVPNYSGGTTVMLAPPTNITGFTAVSGDQQASLTWNNPGGTFAGVRIQRTTGSPATNAQDGVTAYQGAGRSFTNFSLVNTTAYYFTAFSYDALLDYSSGVATSVVPADVTPPADVSSVVVDSSNTTVFLSWVNPTNNDFVGVRVQRKIGSAPTNYADGTTVYSSNGTQCADTGLVNGSNYCYRLFAYDEVPNYSAGVAVSSMPLRILFVETFENAAGWTDHAGNGSTGWVQNAATGVWTAGHYIEATSSNAWAHSGNRCIRFASSYEQFYLPTVNNPGEVRSWMRSVGYATDAGVRLQWYDGSQWKYGPSAYSVGDVYTQIVLRIPDLIIRSAQPIRIDNPDGDTIIDDVEIRVAP